MISNALVILSGGQDSTTCLFWAKQKFRHLHTVSFNYGQKHKAELIAAAKIANMAGCRSHEVIFMPCLLRSTSPLLNPKASLETYESFAEMDRIIGDRVELTFVPLRNLLFLVVAANRAVALGCTDLVVGVCQSDNANYPDCRAVFVDAAERAMRYALGDDRADHAGRAPLRVHTPLMHLTKAETVRLAEKLPGCMEALAYSHTAYDGQYPPVSKDHASVLRAHGFEEAGIPDPLVVRAWKEGLMALPDTPNYDELRDRAA
jgi:7-cyano-7-deazaguanine synthase